MAAKAAALVGLVLDLAIPRTSLRAQSARTAIVVGTGDERTGLFLPMVQVRIGTLNLTRYTDSLGRATFPHVPSGQYTIEARRLGYELLSAPVLVRSEDSLEVVLLMHAATTQLDTMRVNAAAIPAFLSEFERHRSRGFGQFVTEAQIDSMPGASWMSLVEAKIRGLTVTGERGAAVHLMSTRPATEHALISPGGVFACWPTVYLDGLQLIDDTGNGPDLSIVSLSAIGGIEYYAPSEVPVEYKSSGGLQPPDALSVGNRVSVRGGAQKAIKATASPSCGVVLIWSRP